MTEGGARESPTFAADAMLGRLAKLLRMIGYDVWYRPHVGDFELKHIAMREGRVLLTRDTEIAETNLPVQVLLVGSDHPDEQLRQVVRDLSLATDGPLFTRCLLCSTPVEQVPKADIEDAVPPYVFSTQERFARCPSCGRIYWAATHVEKARRWLDRVLGPRREARDDEP
jgi:uncharacterized protein with PIN domain